jgi:hypothetical protein
MSERNAPNPPRSAEAMQNEIFRRMTPEQRLECAFRWTNTTLEFCRSGIRSQHPDWSPARVEREVFRRATGIDLEPLFGPLPKDSSAGIPE